MLKKAVFGLLLVGMILVAGCDYMQSYGFKMEITNIQQDSFTDLVRVSFTVENTGYRDLIDFAGTMHLKISGYPAFEADYYVGDLIAGNIYPDFVDINIGSLTYNYLTDYAYSDDYRFDIEEDDDSTVL